MLLQNNSATVQPVTLFSTTPAQSGTLNGINYAWDISTLSPVLLTSVSLQAGSVGSGLLTYTARIAADSLQAIVDALNTLNAGFFYVTSTSGVTRIRTSNRLLAYGNLTINQGYIWQTTGLVTVVNAGISSMDFQVTDTTTGFVLNNILQPGAPPYSFPVNTSQQVPPSQLVIGDNILLDLPGVPPLLPKTYSGAIKQNGVVIRTISVTIPTLAVNFPYVAGAVYDFQITIT